MVLLWVTYNNAERRPEYLAEEGKERLRTVEKDARRPGRVVNNKEYTILCRKGTSSKFALIPPVRERGGRRYARRRS